MHGAFACALKFSRCMILLNVENVTGNMWCFHYTEIKKFFWFGLSDVGKSKYS